MHSVSYRELEEFETARDEGDGRTDHKHLGHQRGHTPLHVSGIDSDANHRTSWYHTLKSKCLSKILCVFFDGILPAELQHVASRIMSCLLVSSQCPQKGCYDCPAYTNPGDNPNWQKSHRESEHARAQYFIEQGDVDRWRKTADL
jgi:hypothetical protein